MFKPIHSCLILTAALSFLTPGAAADADPNRTIRLRVADNFTRLPVRAAELEMFLLKDQRPAPLFLHFSCLGSSYAIFKPK